MRKLLVANRSEIAIRVFRAATELGLGTVAVYSFEDRFAVHRFKADEAYLIGQAGEPIRAYLDIHNIVLLAQRQAAETFSPRLRLPYLLGYSSYLAGYDDWKYDGTICSNHVHHAAAEIRIVLPAPENRFSTRNAVALAATAEQAT